MSLQSGQWPASVQGYPDPPAMWTHSVHDDRQTWGYTMPMTVSEKLAVDCGRARHEVPPVRGMHFTRTLAGLGVATSPALHGRAFEYMAEL